MFTKKYRLFESLKVTSLLTLVGGFIDVFTFYTQGDRFAAMQTGNLIQLIVALAKGRFLAVFDFALPIVVFILGNIAVILIRRLSFIGQMRWHLLGSRLMIIVAIISAIVTPMVSSNWTIAILAFYAAVQLGFFKRVRGTPYANTMMTGNMRRATNMLTLSFLESDKEKLEIGLNSLMAILTFAIGGLLSVFLIFLVQDYALWFILIPLLYLHLLLLTEEV